MTPATFRTPTALGDQQRPRERRRLRCAVRIAAAAGLATTLTTGLTLQASAQPNISPNGSAKRAGITAVGDAYAGWAMQSQQSRRPAAQQPDKVSGVKGIDVSRYQGNVNWKSWWNKGKRFAYVKATEGTYNRNAKFAQQYNGSYKQGMIRGAYHFANPKDSSGTAQANYFTAHGGGWSSDGKTLPGVLDLEDNPYTGGRCYGKTNAQMVSWVTSFVNQYKSKTSRDPVIYTNAPFWRDCLGNTTKFRKTSPLWIAAWSSTPPKTLPGGWPVRTFWQYSGTGSTDLDAFNGSMARLKALAKG